MHDFFRTACDLAGIEAPENINGISVLPTLLGHKQSDRRPLYWEFYSGFQQAVRLEQWKGLRYGTEKPLELYNIKHDPRESQDLSDKHPDIVNRMEQIMQKEHEPSRYFKTRK